MTSAKDFRAARSWLFVPGDSERKIARSLDSDADALVFDLEDSVAQEAKLAARALVAQVVPQARAARPATTIVVRINALETGMAADDFSALLGTSPDAILLPKANDAATIGAIADIMEAIEAGSLKTPILAIATENALATFRLREIATAHPRVKGIAFGVEDLAATMGLGRTRTEEGYLLPVFQTVRHLAVLAAHSAGIAAIDTPQSLLDRPDLLQVEAREASASGFTGKFALHPNQVPPINEALRIDWQARAEAEDILDISQNGGGSVFRYKGRMIDAPHLQAARVLLARAQGQDRMPSSERRGPTTKGRTP